MSERDDEAPVCRISATEPFPYPSRAVAEGVVDACIGYLKVDPRLSERAAMIDYAFAHGAAGMHAVAMVLGATCHCAACLRSSEGAAS